MQSMKKCRASKRRTAKAGMACIIPSFGCMELTLVKLLFKEGTTGKGHVADKK